MTDNESEHNVWCLVMFDLPTLTKPQRREAAHFRHQILDLGFFMVQFSVYAKHARHATEYAKAIRYIKCHIPRDGEVRMAMMTDTQWANMYRYVNKKPESPEPKPTQLEIF